MSQKLQIKKDPMCVLLRDDKVDEFNKRKNSGDTFDLTFCDLRGLDLRNLEVDGIDFSGCYFRQSDLRGLDFSNSNLEGASINGAKISGCFFPKAISADELNISLHHGTRMRYQD